MQIKPKINIVQRAGRTVIDTGPRPTKKPLIDMTDESGRRHRAMYIAQGLIQPGEPEPVFMTREQVKAYRDTLIKMGALTPVPPPVPFWQAQALATARNLIRVGKEVH